eukprot:4323239-Amphidinium_carterae.1
MPCDLDILRRKRSIMCRPGGVVGLVRLQHPLRRRQLLPFAKGPLALLPEGVQRPHAGHIPYGSGFGNIRHMTTFFIMLLPCCENGVNGWSQDGTMASMTVHRRQTSENIVNFGFVGLTDKWDASICLFHAMYGGGNCVSAEFLWGRGGEEWFEAICLERTGPQH